MNNHFENIKKYIDNCNEIRILLYNENIVKSESDFNTKISYIDEFSKTLILSSKDPFIKLLSEMILNNNKNITFIFGNAIIGALFYYEKYNMEYINILLRAHSIITYKADYYSDYDEKFLENIILKNNNLQKLKIGSDIKINNDMCYALQSKLLRCIEISDNNNTDWNNIYKIIKIKSLNKITINFCHKTNNSSIQLIKMIERISKNLEKNIKMILPNKIMYELFSNIDYSRIIMCNFKIEIKKKFWRVHEYLVYNYIPRKFKTFENFYNFNFIYI